VRQLGVKRESATVQMAPELALVDSDQLDRQPHAKTSHVSQRDSSTLIRRKNFQCAFRECQDLLERVISRAPVHARPRVGRHSDVA
jgi:hypothetical protein